LRGKSLFSVAKASLAISRQLTKFAEIGLRRERFCPILAGHIGKELRWKTPWLIGSFGKKDTGLRCGGRGKSEISPAL
jgi:hypothetical protein